MAKLAWAYGYKYQAIHCNAELIRLEEVLKQKGPMICEVFVSREQVFEPKSATKN